MPQFVLNTSDSVTGSDTHAARHDAWRACDAFTRGYIEAMFFTMQNDTCGECEACLDDARMQCESDSHGGQLKDACGVMDIHPDALESIKADCNKFQDDAARLLRLAYGTDYTEERAGADFLFTRNGHGVGFWDRDELHIDVEDFSSLGDGLSDIARGFGESDLYEGQDDSGAYALYV